MQMDKPGYSIESLQSIDHALKDMKSDGMSENEKVGGKKSIHFVVGVFGIALAAELNKSITVEGRGGFVERSWFEERV